MARDLQKQQRYVDQYDGPSSLITLSPTPQASCGAKSSRTGNYYDNERKTFYSSIGSKQFAELAKNSSSQIDSNFNESVQNEVKSPKQRFEEFKSLRQSLQDHKDFQAQKRFLNQRDRLMKNSWRHGILGVENPDDPKSEVYQQMNSERQTMYYKKENHASRRQHNLIKVWFYILFVFRMILLTVITKSLM